MVFPMKNLNTENIFNIIIKFQYITFSSNQDNCTLKKYPQVWGGKIDCFLLVPSCPIPEVLMPLQCLQQHHLFSNVSITTAF